MNSSITGTKTQASGDILIVDDTPANLRLLADMLVKQGHRVRLAPNGRLALMNAQATPPDLILLDIKMPGMSGYEVCEQLKADPRTREIPVLFISALDQILDKVKAFQVGGVDYITKPFQAEEVFARVETHLALHDLHQSLQAKIAELDAFAHTVAHDLKTPLSVVLGYASFLAEESIEGQEKMFQECVNAIARTSRKMDTIIDELLLLSSVRQMEEVPLAPLDMTIIVAEAQARLATLTTKRQAEIVLPDRWPVVLGYSPWLEEVWVNYISNAIKYGGRLDEGIPPRVELGFDEPASQQASDDGHHIRTVGDLEQGQAAVRFWVRDNGPGLTPDEQAKLFTPFTRLHQAGAKGYGLGLSIVQRIVDKLGGQVGVESTVGQGSTFSFTLPSR